MRSQKKTENQRGGAEGRDLSGGVKKGNGIWEEFKVKEEALTV